MNEVALSSMDIMTNRLFSQREESKDSLMMSSSTNDDDDDTTSRGKRSVRLKKSGEKWRNPLGAFGLH